MKTLENLRSTHIIYLKADLDYTTYHLIDGRKNVSSFTLKKYEQKQELGAFFRVSKSCLINPVSFKIASFKAKKHLLSFQMAKMCKFREGKLAW